MLGSRVGLTLAKGPNRPLFTSQKLLRAHGLSAHKPVYAGEQGVTACAFGLRHEPLKAAPEAAKTMQPHAEPFEAGSEQGLTDGEIKKMATRKPPAAPAPVSTEPEPKLDPIVRASMDLAARALLVLRTDSWLSRLAEHSPDVRTKILAALSDELLRTGFVSGDFCARLYNDSRPRALSQFPPRQF